jgi:hypothetical protein
VDGSTVSLLKVFFFFFCFWLFIEINYFNFVLEQYLYL